MTCIFCHQSAAVSSVEHILPESLGGKEWACLPSGLVCAKCNQYFGAKVEAPALDSFPFLPFRLLLGIPTKKNSAPQMRTHLGALKGSPFRGRVGIDPSSAEVDAAIRSGKITQVRIVAEPTEPLAVCRLLLKMGIEVVAGDTPADARSGKFDAARRFARAPLRKAYWWFLLHTNHDALFEKFRRGVSWSEWVEGVLLEVVDEQGAEIFHLKLLDMDLLTPLEDRVSPPDMEALPEPDYRLFEVRA